MLRRNHENSFEFLLVERALQQLAPGKLTLERKIALRDRIFSQLGPQDVPWRESARGAIGARWVAVPAGIGIAAAVLTALADAGLLDLRSEPAEQRMAAAPEFQVIGAIDGDVERGRLVTARTASWITHGRSVFGLEAGSSVIFHRATEHAYDIELVSGEINVATDVAHVRVALGLSAAELGPGGSLKATRVDSLSTVTAIRGAVNVSTGGATFPISPEDGTQFLSNPGEDSGPPSAGALPDPSGPASDGSPGQAPSTPPGLITSAGGGQPPASSGQAPDDVPPPDASSPGEGNGPPAHAPGPPDNPGPGNSQGTPPADPGHGNGQGNPPQEPGADPGQGNPPSDPGGGNGTPPEDPGGGDGNAPGSPPEDPGNGHGPGNGNGQGNPPEDPGGGNGNAPGNPPQDSGHGGQGGNGNGQGNGNGNGNAHQSDSVQAQAVQPANPGKALAKGHVVEERGPNGAANGQEKNGKAAG